MPRAGRGAVVSLAGGHGQIDTLTGVVVRAGASVSLGSLEDLLAFCVFAVKAHRLASLSAGAHARVADLLQMYDEALPEAVVRSHTISSRHSVGGGVLTLRARRGVRGGGAM